jgi:hypothetical protein
MKVLFEIEESDVERLLDIQNEVLDTLIRIERLLKELTDGDDTRSKSKKSRSAAATRT